MQRPPAPQSGFSASTQIPGSVGVNGPAGAPGVRPASGHAEPNVDGIIGAINEIRAKILELLNHIENQSDSLSWNVVMDKFSVISSGLSNLSKMMKSERAPDFRRYGVIPVFVSPDADPVVEQITERRVSAVNHDIVPNYLRTKLDPEVEERFIQALAKCPAPQVQDAAQKADKQIQNSNKIVGQLVDQLQTTIRDWDTGPGSKVSLPKFYNEADTTALMTAVWTGRGLSSNAHRSGAPR